VQQKFEIALLGTLGIFVGFLIERGFLQVGVTGGADAGESVDLLASEVVLLRAS